MDTTKSDAIRPFRVNVPDAELTELRRRISATRWPDRETATDQSQGPPIRSTLPIRLTRDIR